MVLRDEQWERLAPLLPGKVGDPRQSAADNRLFLEAVLWGARVGAPWRDLPESFGKWNSVFQRFRRWARRGVFEQIFTVLSEDADFEYVIVDGTIVRVHQHGTAALLADKAFDSDTFRADLNERGALAVIPPKANRTQHISCDFKMYKWRHLVENFFCSLKAFRRIATRYDKTDTSYAAMIHLAGTVLALR